MSDIAEAIRNMSMSMDEIRHEIRHEINKHSLAQELIDEGAYDVAIAYINFLKGNKADKGVKK